MKKTIIAMAVALVAAAGVSTAQNIKPDFVFVEGGTFQMGSTDGDSRQKPIHNVTVSSFYMCDHEVTQKEYRYVMGTNPSYFKDDGKPVEQVTWYSAIEYCNRRSAKEGLTPCYTINGDSTTCNFNANGYRLPTEAEWEYAARGGKKSNCYTYSGSNSLGNVAWYYENSYKKGSFHPDYGTHVVKTKSPNELGLYDMSGNVLEWCWDWYGSYTSSSQTNPVGSSLESGRVYRGGCYYFGASDCRVAYRDNSGPSYAYSSLGFRVVCSASNSTTVAAPAKKIDDTKDGFVFVEGGTFEMGSNDGYSEKPVHSVTVSSFYMCDHEVTQKEYRDVMGTNPSWFSGDNRPVEKVSWYDAIEYCNRRSTKEGLTPCYTINGDSTTCNFSANGYRLPTEAEWEYAARGGKKNNGYTYSGSNSIGNVAWYDDNSGDCTHDVKTKSPNELGLYDMSGNVYEWCWDWYGSYSSSSQTNPTGASSGAGRALRGGSWSRYVSYCRVACRGYFTPSRSGYYLGFRVACSTL